MSEEPKAVAWWADAPIDPADPLAAVKWRARDLDAAAEVLGQAARSGRVAARADRIGPVAALVTDEAFTAGEVKEMWQRSGLSDDDLDAAMNAAEVLWTIEELRR